MSAKSPKTILHLVERFDRDRAVFLSGDYKEEQLRAEFLNPLFEALGWDVYNRQGLSETYKPVIHEESIKVAGASKAPDYTFRIGGRRVFFTEAKKPSVKVAEDIAPAFQLRRYAWTAKLPVSILTDFEEFAVYDCRIRPFKTDKASVGRTMLLSFKDYLTRWDELSGLLSPEAIQKGALERYVESTKTKKGTAAVDDAFLLEISGWREMLARNIALRNPRLSTRELNFAVQRTIDRLIFLRICEDRGIESYAYLQSLLNGTNVYARLKKHFYDADNRYNSGLFHFAEEEGRAESPDRLTLDLQIDDKPLKDIISGLYYPDSPYEFSVMPAEVLGQVYEQFLGKVIRLTAGHQAKVEDKPEVRKAGGVYYTPAYIVDYIVKNTVGKLLEDSSPQPSPRRGEGEDSLSLERERARVRVTPNKGLTPEQASRLRILDPACGSGSFLLGAYQYLLDWHLDYYQKERGRGSGARGQGPTYKDASGNLRLTTAERKRILLNNIYGVDIDSQAVEVTKLSLLLKVLEGENQETLRNQLRFFKERALPDLGSNIKCGNSLIGPDFYHGEQQTMFEDEEERLRINVFDWNAAFPQILGHSERSEESRSTGFDAVIGNPPYLRIQGLQEYYGEQINYFLRNYDTAEKRFDLSMLFTERGFDLLRDGGRLGYICPHKFVNTDYGSGLRRFLRRNTAIDTLVSFGNNLIFEQATTYTGVLLLEKSHKRTFRYFEFADTAKRDIEPRLVSIKPASLTVYPYEDFGDEPWVLTKKEVPSILRTLSRQRTRLGDVCDEILVGVQSGIDNVHVLRAVGRGSKGRLRLYSDRAEGVVELEAGLVKPFLRGEDVHRYEPLKPEYYCVYPYALRADKTVILEEGELNSRFPSGYRYLKEYRRELTDIRVRQKTNPRYWYSCHRPREMSVFERARIVTPYISLGCNMTLAGGGIYHNTKVYSILPCNSEPQELLFWLALLNSKLVWWFVSNTGYVLRGGYYAFTTDYLGPFPVPRVEAVPVATRRKFASFAERMLDLNKQLPKAKTPHERESLERTIAATDRQIDQLVYELYGLTDEEVSIVEDASQPRR